MSKLMVIEMTIKANVFSFHLIIPYIPFRVASS